MKTAKVYFLTVLVIAAVVGAMLGPAQGDPLKNVRQICQIYYDTQALNWKRIMPDGTIQSFTLKPWQSFVMTGAYVRFYANTVDTGPYRFFLKAPNGSRIWNATMTDVLYPTTGNTVYGGTTTITLDPGISINVAPTWEVRQLPVPPNNPNSGPVVSGTPYIRLTGYVSP